MAAPNMAAITASLERSLQNCSLNHQQSSSSSSSSSSGSGGGGAAAQGPDSPPEAAAPTLELNSEGALPFHWEQCLDLKTGEIYYINWRTGMKAKEDPRSTADYGGGGEYYSEDDNSSYDSEGSSSSSESCPSSSREQWSGHNDLGNYYFQENNENEDNNNNINNNSSSNNNVLVVAGCKSCLMYYMVPKQLEVCPKCCGQLLHFDRSENGSN